MEAQERDRPQFERVVLQVVWREWGGSCVMAKSVDSSGPAPVTGYAPGASWTVGHAFPMARTPPVGILPVTRVGAEADAAGELCPLDAAWLGNTRSPSRAYGLSVSSRVSSLMVRTRYVLRRRMSCDASMVRRFGCPNGSG